MGAASAQAALTAPSAGGVYRGDVPFNEDTGGRSASNLTPADVPGVSSLDSQDKLDASAGYTALGFSTGCLVKGNGILNSNTLNPLKATTAADTMAQGSVKITRDSDNATVYTSSHLSNQDLLAAPAPYRAQPFGGTWLTAGAPAGMYTAYSYKRDIRRGDPAAPVLPTDSNSVKAGKKNNVSTCRINDQAVVNDKLVSTVHFEYRPWEQRFKDTLQTAGGVDFNLNAAREFQMTLRGGRQSTIKAAPSAFTVVKLPTDASLLLPSDPAVCAADPAACLPPTPPECESKPSACSDRLVLINYKSDAAHDAMLGFFDLETRAFVASVRVGDSVSLLKSAGTLDPQIHALKSQLMTAAASMGINAAQVSAMKISSVSGGSEVKLSLDEGLERLTSTGLADGNTVQGAPAVNAGVVLHLILGGYKGTAAGPYKVYGSSLTAPPVSGVELPALPAPLSTYGPLVNGLIASGGLGVRQVQASGYTGGQHIYALAAGIEPKVAKLLYIPGDTGTITDKSFDFVGAPLSITQGGVCNSTGDCTGLALMVGAGAALYDSPVTIPPLFAP